MTMAAAAQATPEGARPPPAARRRSWGWLDFVLLLAVALSCGYFVWNTTVVFKYHWDWSTIWPFIFRIDPATGNWVPNILFEGLLTTLRLAVWGILCAGIIGTVMGIARTSPRLLFRLLSGLYVMLIRNIPPVVFVFVFVFFVASQIMPKLAIGNSVATLSASGQWWVSVFFGTPKLIDNFLLGLICLSVFSGAYVTEIVRAGLESVPRSQIEAGDSLGFSRLDVMRFVILPQALRNVLPPMAGQFIQLIKDSSLVSLVSIQELTFMAQDVQVTTQRVFEVFVFVGAVYFVICFTLSRLFAGLERHYARAHR
jgi:polar amino acid transport system permease protein